MRRECDLDAWLEQAYGKIWQMPWDEIREWLSVLQSELDEVKEFRRNGKFIVRIKHRTGVTVERVCGASKNECRREVFRELLNQLSEERRAVITEDRSNE